MFTQFTNIVIKRERLKPNYLLPECDDLTENYKSGKLFANLVNNDLNG